MSHLHISQTIFDNPELIVDFFKALYLRIQLDKHMKCTYLTVPLHLQGEMKLLVRSNVVYKHILHSIQFVSLLSSSPYL